VSKPSGSPYSKIPQRPPGNGVGTLSGGARRPIKYQKGTGGTRWNEKNKGVTRNNGTGWGRTTSKRPNVLESNRWNNYGKSQNTRPNIKASNRWNNYGKSVTKKQDNILRNNRWNNYGKSKPVKMWR
jgi:hypothetical protein